MNQPPKRFQDRRESLGFTIRFRTEDGKIPPELFDKTAHEAAKEVARSNPQVNKNAQLRRFYDELALWEEKAARSSNFDECLPFIRMLKAKVAYARGRRLVDGRFVDLLNQTVDFIQSAADLKVAKLFLEAFLGFYKLEKRED